MVSTARPGVYTTYSLAAGTTSAKGRGIGVAAACSQAVSGVQKLESFAQARKIFGEPDAGNPLALFLQTIYQNVQTVVYAVATDGSEAGTRAALETLFSEAGVYVLCTDFTGNSLHDFFKETLDQSAENGREKLLVLPGTIAPDTLQKAQELNSMRVCVTHPAVLQGNISVDCAPALLAAFVSRSQNPGGSLNGETAESGLHPAGTVSEEDLSRLIKGGVCVLEERAGLTQLVRGVTTATRDAQGNPDASLRSLNVLLITDTVIPTLRSMLEEKLRTARNSRASLDAIRSLIACKLSDFEDSGLLSSYEMPLVSLAEDDDTLCVAEVAFTVMQGLYRVELHAQISV